MLAAIIAIFAIIADQISKYFVVQAATPIDRDLEGASEWTQAFIPKIISFVYDENTGAAFSSFDEPNQRWIFMLFSFISMGVIVYLLIKEYRRHMLMNVALAMVLGGGIGNMIDRIYLGYVVDFLRFDFVDFAIFNIADSFITVGAVLLAVYIIFFETKVEKRIQAEKAAAVAENAEENTENE